MNDLGAVLIGAAARGTAFACLGLLLCAVLRRRGPGASSTVALATLVGMVGVTAMGASPWPRWSGLVPSASVAPDRPAEPDRAPVIKADGAGPVDLPAPPVSASVGPFDTGVGLALRELGRALLRPQPTAEATGWGWRAWVAAGALAGIGVGLARFGAGLLAVAALRSRSRPAEDPDLIVLADLLRAEIGLGRPVDLRVAPGLATPATVGWRRPAILLPEDWAAWDDRERKVVLSHELAHIKRNDYLSGVWAHLSLALHYYNPLAHRLAGRLRLDQELAADAWGARLSGGNRPYLAALARLALRSDPRPAGWPARAIRPGRGTFMRRIEMLRDANDLSPQPSPLPRPARALTFGLLGLAGLALAGVRGPEAPALADPPQKADAPPRAGGAIDLAYIPADAAMIAVLRPADLLARPEFAKLLAMVDTNRSVQGTLNMPPDQVEQVTLYWSSQAMNGPENRPTFAMVSGSVFRAAKPQDWKAVAGKFVSGAVEARFGDHTYFKAAQGPVGLCYAIPNDRTIVVAQESDLLRMLTAQAGATERAAWAGAWKAVKKGQVAIAIDATWLFLKLKPGLPGGSLGGFAPLLERAQGYAISIDAGATIAVDGVATCGSDEAAGLVADTLRAGITLLRNTAETLGQQAKAQGNQVPFAFKLVTDMGVPLLARAKVTTEAKTVRFGTTSDLKLADVLAAFVPAVIDARATAKRMQSINNLKQIGLAMHNYASANGHFPPAVLLGPDGKTPHSWRVAILPYLDQQPLSTAYQYNEPWDSPNNRQVLAHMPEVFRHPNGKPGNTSYLAITGKDTVFSGHEGVDFAKITDGTSNTILVVEADRDIPWTKPDDIPFDPNAPLPRLGGLTPDGFNALFGDGSVRFIKETIRPEILKALFTKAGGEVIDRNAF